MRYDKQAKLRAEAKHDKSIFVFRVIGIMLQAGILIGKHAGCFFKGDAMLALIRSFFPIIPGKLYSIHIAMILLIAWHGKKNPGLSFPQIGIGPPLAERPSHPTIRTDHVYGESAVQADNLFPSIPVEQDRVCG